MTLDVAGDLIARPIRRNASAENERLLGPAGAAIRMGMGVRLGTLAGDIQATIKKAIEDGIAGADVEVSGGGGHFSIVVTSAQFAGKSPVAAQRLVYSTIKHLMSGDGAPLHAVDSMKTIVP